LNVKEISEGNYWNMTEPVGRAKGVDASMTPGHYVVTNIRKQQGVKESWWFMPDG